jgi:DNA-binding NarL/FixJ family response regulator
MTVRELPLHALGQESWKHSGTVATVLDLALPFGQIARCIRLSQQRAPDAAVMGITCCHSLLTTCLLEDLLREQIGCVIDLESSPEEALSVLQAYVERNDSVLVRTAMRRSGSTNGSNGGPVSSPDRALLHLVARGLTDTDIAGRLSRSPHTVKHQIERLRSTVGVRNRTELAAWAGLNGYYSVEGLPA